jgi:glutamate-1-semialdehyde aminotransferase
LSSRDRNPPTGRPLPLGPRQSPTAGRWPEDHLIGVGVEQIAEGKTAYYTYNDLASVEKLVTEHHGDLAGVIVSPFRHDAGFDQEMVDPAFAQGLRRICDENDAMLILDEVRTGFRMSFGGSWQQYGVRPDLSS